MSDLTLRARKCLAWIVAGAALAVGPSCRSTSEVDKSGSEVISEERGVRVVGTEKSPSTLEPRNPAPVRPLTDIDGKDGSLTILFLGDGRGNLQGVSREFRAIIEVLSPLEKEGYLHVNFLVGRNLTKQNLESRILETKYAVIHYAGHAFEKGHVLPFADSDLDTREFLTIVNRNPPTLLVMNACNSLGDPESLDLMKSLFVDSSAIFVIGTSWVVQDSVQADLFPHFYEALIRGSPVGDAFNYVMQKHPRSLVQYFLLGDPSIRL
jgi:hypothetical protein